MKREIIVIFILSVLFFDLARGQNINYGESFELDGTLNAGQSFEYKAKDYIIAVH